MAALTVNVLADTGAAPSLVAASASDTAIVGNGLNTFLVYRNVNATAGTTATVTITPPGKTPYGENWTPKAVTVPGASGEKWIPLRREYADDTGKVTIAHSGAALSDLKVAVVRLG